MADEPSYNCHYCDNPAEADCPTCGRLYCAEHGDDVCMRCMSPESAVPSAAIYRGSIVALIIATAVVVFLLVRPPENKTPAAATNTLPTSTAAIAATATPTAQGGRASATPRPGTQVPSSVTVSPTTAAATQAPSASPTQAGRTYVMKQGDTLSAVAASFGVTVADIVAANPGINPDTIDVGTEIRIP